MQRFPRSPKNLTLNDVCPAWFNPEYVGSTSFKVGGIFYALSSISQTNPEKNFPWFGESVSDNNAIGSYLDRTYHGVRSGNKFITELLYKCLSDPRPDFDTGGLPFLFSKSTLLNYAVYEYYYMKWQHLWDDYTAEYNALHSYSIEDTESLAENETTTPDITDATTITDSTNDSEMTIRTPNITEGVQIAGSDTKTPNLAESETVVETRNTTDETTYGKKTEVEAGSMHSEAGNVYGFNSDDPVPKETSSGREDSGQTSQDSGKDTITNTGSVTTGRQFSRTGTEGDSYTESSTRQTTGSEQGTKSNTHQRSGSNTTRRTGTQTVAGTRSVRRTRQGTMFKSPAELLKADREFWMTHYFEIIFEDMDKILTLPFISEKEVKFKVY